MKFLKIILPFVILLIETSILIAGFDDFKAISRMNYYTTENTGQVIIIVPEDLQKENIKIDLVYKYEHLIKGYPIPNNIKTGLVPFNLSEFEEGIDTITCSFYVNEQWVKSEYVVITKLKHKSNAVKIDHYSGGLFVDDLPFFPFGFYCYSPVQPTLPEEEVVKGFNMISPYQKINGKTRKERKKYMDRCAAIGMKVHYNLLSIAGGGGVGSKGHNAGESPEKLKLLEEEIIAFMDHPALLAWYIADEPVGQGVPAEALVEIYNLIKKLDPYHPVSMVFMTPSKAIEYEDVMDIVMADPYPVPNNPITEVAEVTSMLYEEFYPEKPVWIVPQAFGGNEYWKREPTPQEVRAMTYLAIINHASGIQYFIRHGLNSFPKSTTTWNECAAVSLEIADLIPRLFFYHKPVEVNCNDGMIYTRAFEWGGIITILVVNAENSPKQISLNIENFDQTGKADLFYENRQIEVNSGKIDDMIDGYGTRIYSWNVLSIIDPLDKILPENLVVDPGFEESPVPGIPSACYARIGSDRGATYVTDSRIQYQGFYSLRVNTPANKYGVNLSFFPVYLNNNRSYTLSVWARATDPNILTEEKGFFYRLFHKKEEQDKCMKFAMSLSGMGTKEFELTNDWEKYSINVGIHSAKDNSRYGPRMELISKGTAWFDLLELVPDIQILSDPQAAHNGVLIKLTTIHENGVIMYTLDGLEPDMNSKVYDHPFIIDSSVVLKTKVFLDGRSIGFANEEFFIHKGTGKIPTYLTSYSKGYTAGGDKALVDGKIGSTNFKDGLWQGFLKKDCEVIIDLGNTKQVNKITAGFLQDHNAWIFLPELVEYSVSINGKDFDHSITIDYGVSDSKGKLTRKEYKAKFGNVSARYIKMKAKNIGLCPEWHKGKTNAAWLFVDEITIN